MLFGGAFVASSPFLNRHALLRYLTLGWIACFAAAPINAADYRIAHCLGGCPVGAAADEVLLVRSLYATSYSAPRESGAWLAYRMRAGALGIASSLSREFITDPDVPGSDAGAGSKESKESRAQQQGLARVSIVPLVSVAGTPYWYEANLLSATTFRSQGLDRGAWSGLEWSLRNLVNRRGEVTVVTGPIFESAPSGDAEPAGGELPTGFFKLIASAEGELSAFWLDQDFAVHVHHCDARSSLDAIESATGLRFFPEWDRSTMGKATLDAQLGCIRKP